MKLLVMQLPPISRHIYIYTLSGVLLQLRELVQQISGETDRQTDR
jgi:hypothetical protein